jgi:hypothetical protein
MKLPTLFHNNNNKATAEHQSLITAAEEESKRVEPSMSPRDRALERWETKIEQGVGVVRYPVSPRAQTNQLAALSCLPVTAVL